MHLSPEFIISVFIFYLFSRFFTALCRERKMLEQARMFLLMVCKDNLDHVSFPTILICFVSVWPAVLTPVTKHSEDEKGQHLLEHVHECPMSFAMQFVAVLDAYVRKESTTSKVYIHHILDPGFSRGGP